MKTLYVVTGEGLETFVAEGKKGIEKGLRDLYDAQILEITKNRQGDLTIKALDSRGIFPLLAEPHTKIYGEQENV